MRLSSKKVLTQEEPLALSSNFELFCARRKMSSGAMYALTIKPLWLWAILHADKDVENRAWSTKFRGTFLLHSSKACTEKEYLDAYEFIYSVNSDVAETAPDYKTLMKEYAGRICGSVELADVSEVDRCYESFAALKLANRSLAALVLTRCIKGYAEDRAQFRTEYPAEMSIERLKEAYKYCVNYNDAMRDETSEDRAVLAAQSIEEIHAASPFYYERISELAKAPPFQLARIFKELAL